MILVQSPDPVALPEVVRAVVQRSARSISGISGPVLFGALIGTGSRLSVFAGYLFGAALMIAAAVVAALYAVAAERKPLEAVARPLALEE